MSAHTHMTAEQLAALMAAEEITRQREETAERWVKTLRLRVSPHVLLSRQQADSLADCIESIQRSPVVIEERPEVLPRFEYYVYGNNYHQHRERLAMELPIVEFPEFLEAMGAERWELCVRDADCLIFKRQVAR